MLEQNIEIRFITVDIKLQFADGDRQAGQVRPAETGINKIAERVCMGSKFLHRNMKRIFFVCM